MKTNSDIQILSFTPQLASHFKLINQQWIVDMFNLETLDEQMLSSPQEQIIDPGGHIWFAQHSQLGIVGTCALFRKGEGVFELTKMGVLESARGLKVGEFLLQHVLNAARNLDIKCLFLLTNSKCEAAIHLYEKNGFKHDVEIMQQYGAVYERCNVAMRYHF